VRGLVLSLFPGIGLLDMAFEEEGFCVVRGPDLLWGGDIHKFHPPAGRFDGVIGGDPCQAHSRLRYIVEANGHRVAPDMTPEFSRCIEESRPDWFLRENVPDAPIPRPQGYLIRDEIVRDVWVGGLTSRERRFCFGTQDGRKLYIETLALHTPTPEFSVTRDARTRPIKIGGSGLPKREHWSGGRTSSLNRGGGVLPHVGKSMPVSEMARLQGLPDDFLADAPFTSSGKRGCIGNGVPLPMGRAVARAVKAALERKVAA
jgi:DNA (cytosine-5)-methyltransferase 1